MKKMWFGNSTHMTWVPCPRIDMGTGTVHFVAESNFLNGGAAVRRSATGSRRYEMEWPLVSESDLDEVEAFWEGAWGGGPFYFVDPQAAQTNIFPAAWAQPRVALDDGPKLVFDQKPIAVSGTGGTVPPFVGGSWGGPRTGVQYRVTEDSSPLELTIPVPPRHGLIMICSQDENADSQMSYSVDGGAWSSMDTFSLRAVMGDTGGSMVRFSFRGEGNTGFYGMKGVILSETSFYSFPQDSLFRWISGKGNSGCEFVEYTRSTYSAALDRVQGSAVLREIGDWL